MEQESSSSSSSSFLEDKLFHSTLFLSLSCTPPTNVGDLVVGIKAPSILEQQFYPQRRLRGVAEVIFDVKSSLQSESRPEPHLTFHHEAGGERAGRYLDATSATLVGRSSTSPTKKEEGGGGWPPFPPPPPPSLPLLQRESNLVFSPFSFLKEKKYERNTQILLKFPSFFFLFLP